MRSAYIDRLRGLAILIVFLGHSPRYIGEWAVILTGDIYNHITAGAYYGVTIFFVISGYLITNKFIKAILNGSSYDTRSFYIERIARIVPSFFLVILISCFLSIIMGEKLNYFNFLYFMISLIQLDFNNASTMIPHLESSWDAFWSLRVEETFYVFLPIVFLLLVKVRFFVILALVIILVGFLGRSEDNNNIYSFYTTFDQLAVGTLTAIYTPKIRMFLTPVSRSALRWIAGVLVMVVFFRTRCIDGAIWCTLMAVGAALLIIGAPESTGRSSIVFRQLESLGRVSYEVYLFHFMILWALAPLGRFTLTMPLPKVAAFAFLLGTLYLCYGVGLLVAKCYSEPINRVIRRKFSTTSQPDRQHDNFLLPNVPPGHKASVISVYR